MSTMGPSAGASAAAGQQSTNVTVGNSGTAYGTQPPTFGSLSVGSYKGATIIQLINDNNAAGLINVALTGNRAQSFFRTFRLVTDAGTVLSLATASATYSTGGGNTLWEWGATGIIWSTASAVRRVTFIG